MLSDLPPYASKKSKKNSISLDCKSYKSGMLEEEEEGRREKVSRRRRSRMEN